MNKYQYPVEVHSHTYHSDGQFSVSELVDAAVDFGYKGLILTNHNSSAGYLEMAEVEAVKSGALVTLHGMEWTTYFGHMLAHDADYDVVWREATVDTIDDYMAEVRAANGLVGIAHPFDIGSPICTGCHWDFRVKDFSLVNYIEIWNSNSPQAKLESVLAYELWLGKLSEGYEISCSAGRDWHRPDGPDANMGVTYVELAAGEALTPATFKEALRSGSYYITLGPRVQFSVGDWHMGDRVGAGKLVEGGAAEEAAVEGAAADGAAAEVRVAVTPTELRDLKQFPVTHAVVSVWNNDTLLHQSEPVAELGNDGFEVVFTLDTAAVKPGFVRFEVRGDFRGVENTLVVVGNPIYVK